LLEKSGSVRRRGRGFDPDHGLHCISVGYQGQQIVTGVMEKVWVANQLIWCQVVGVRLLLVSRSRKRPAIVPAALQP